MAVLIGILVIQKKQLPIVTMQTQTQTEQSETPPVLEEKIEVVEPARTIMPEPVCITVAQDVVSISDEKLRRFVGKNAVFSRDKVLYFEWNGGPNDKMEGTTVSDIETKDKRYVVSLKHTPGETMLHRQVFIIPRNYTFEVEISK